MAVHDDFSVLIHAAAVKAGMALHFHGDGLGETNRNGMGAHRIEHTPFAFIGVGCECLQAGIQPAHAFFFEVKLDHALPHV